MDSPYTLANPTDDFDLKAHEDAFDKLPDGPDKEAARPVMAALKNKTISPAELPALAAQAQAQKQSAAPAPDSSPNGLPGIPQAGPPTQAQAAQGMSGPSPLMQAGPANQRGNDTPAAAPVAPSSSQGGNPYGVPNVGSQTQSGPATFAQAQSDPMPNRNPAMQNPQAQAVAMPGQITPQARANQIAVLAQQGGWPIQGTNTPMGVPVQARGSGGTATETATQSQGLKSFNTQKNGMNPDTIASVLSAVNNSDVNRQAQGGINALQNQLAMMQPKDRGAMGGDLGGFMAMFSKPGQNLAEGYVPPAQRDMAAQAQRIGLMEKIQAAQDSLANNQSSILKAGSGGLVGTQQDAMMRIMQMIGSKDPQLGSNPVRAANSFNTMTSKALKSNDTAADILSEVAREVVTGSNLADARLPILRAKIDASGRPNQSEVDMEGGDRSFIEQINQKIHTFTQGDMSPHNRQLFMEDLKNLAQLHQTERDQMFNRFREQGRTQYQQTPDQIEAALPTISQNRWAVPLADIARGQRRYGRSTDQPPGVQSTPAGAIARKDGNGKVWYYDAKTKQPLPGQQ